MRWSPSKLRLGAHHQEHIFGNIQETTQQLKVKVLLKKKTKV